MIYMNNYLESKIIDTLNESTTSNNEGGNKQMNSHPSLDNELRILNMMNESLQDQVDAEDNPDKKELEVDPVDNIYVDEPNKYPDKNSDEPVVDLIDKDGNVHCDVCGTMFKLEDGTVCPVCGTDHSDSLPVSDDPQVFAESLLSKYESLVDDKKFTEAKELLKENEATILCEGSELILEAYKVHVDSTGKKTKVKVKTKRTKLSSAQKKALAKARKKAHTGSANKARAKAINKRASMGLNESLVKVGNADDDATFGTFEPLPGDSHVRVFSTDNAYVVVGRDDDDETVIGVFIVDDNTDDVDYVFTNKSELTDKEAIDLAEKLAKKLSKSGNTEEALKVLKSSPEMMKESVDIDESCTDDDTDECSCKVNESVKFEEDGGGFFYAEISDDLNVTYGYDEDLDEYTVYITAMNDDQDQYLAMAEAHYEDDAKRIATSIATKLAKSPTKSSVAQLVKKYNMDDDDSDIDLKDTSLKESTDCEDDDDNDEVTESYKVHVSADGTKTKKKVRTKRVRLSSAQKAALRKARKFAHKGSANRSRARAMKKRKSLGL